MTGQSPAQRSGDNLYPAQLELQFGDHQLELDVPAGVWNPTPHGVHLGQCLTRMDFEADRVLELGTGCGIHAILLARRGAKELVVTEIDEAILANARHNLEKHACDLPVTYVKSDWTRVSEGGFDTVVTNPPFAKSGKRYRRYFIDTLILDAHKLLRPGGRLVFVQSSMADIPRSVRLMEENGMQLRICGETDGPFRPYYFEDPAFLVEMASTPGAYEVRSGVHCERLIVFEATLPAA